MILIKSVMRGVFNSNLCISAVAPNTVRNFHNFIKGIPSYVRQSSFHSSTSKCHICEFRVYKGLIKRQPVRLCSHQTIPPKTKQSKIVGPITWKSLLITAGFGSVFLFAVYYMKREKELKLAKERKRILGKAAIGGEFDLIDHDGKPCSSKDFHGRWILLYFGFTHCPDICPDEMEKMVEAVEIVDKMESVPKVQPVFISVDPERDNVKAVGAYVKEFSPKMIGLTGSIEQVQKACKAFRVYHSAGPKDDDMDYIVDHTIIIYLINPEGEFVDYFGQNMAAEEIANCVTVNMVKHRQMTSKSLF